MSSLLFSQRHFLWGHPEASGKIGTSALQSTGNILKNDIIVRSLLMLKWIIKIYAYTYWLTLVIVVLFKFNEQWQESDRRKFFVTTVWSIACKYFPAAAVSLPLTNSLIFRSIYVSFSAGTKIPNLSRPPTLTVWI